MRSKTKLWLILTLLVVIGAAVRLHRLDTLPPGIYPDEAVNGIDARESLENRSFHVFYEDNNGRKGLHIVLTSVMFWLFGVSIWSLRLTSAIAGIATIFGIYFLAREMLNRRIAIIAAAMLTISAWHVNFSRIAFAGILAPCFLVWTLYFFWRGLKSMRLLPFLLSGVMLGLGFYTYPAFRVVPFVLLVPIFFRQQWKDRNVQKGVLACMAVALVVALPLVHYIVTAPDTFHSRAKQVSVFQSSNPIRTLAANCIKAFGMFHVAGDNNWRHNISGKPMLSLPLGIFFTLGLLITGYQLLRRSKAPYPIDVVIQTLFWLGAGLLPAIFTSEGVPHALRSIVVIPAVCLISALGINLLASHTSRATLFALLFSVLVGIAEYERYFVTWASRQEVRWAFRAYQTELARQLNEAAPDQKKYVIVKASGILLNGTAWRAQPIAFLTDTVTPEKQAVKNVIYLADGDEETMEFEPDSLVVTLRY